MRHFPCKVAGFTLIEAVLIMVIMAVAFLGFGFLFGNVTQRALQTDLTVLATKLARQKMDEVMQTKADSGYAAVASSAPSSVSSGTWNFTRQVDANYVNSSDFSSSAIDTGYKKVVVTVSWGSGTGEAISLTALLTDMVPADVEGPGGLPPCP